MNKFDGSRRSSHAHATFLASATALAALLFVPPSALPADPAVPIVLAADASPALRSAARDLADALGRLHPDFRFKVTDRIPAAGDSILLGTAADPAIAPLLGAERPAAPEGCIVRTRREGGRTIGVIAGADVPGAVFGIYALLERTGCGFYLSFDAHPAPAGKPFSFDGWDFTDHPLAPDRIVFNWHNFLSGCSSWNFEEWALWIDQARKMRFNTIMVHAYGNNPMFTFSFGGREKPAGYLTTTSKGRDWGTEHINDVRLLPGGGVFSVPIFGAEAALAPDNRRVAESQALMKRVFAHAAEQGMHLCFALDVDTISSNPQDLILTLPEKARFKLADGKTWLPRPDTPEGYAYFKTQAATLFNLYPQIDRLVIWIRTGGTTWTSMKPEELPREWREEYAARTKAHPEITKLQQGAGRLGIGKITEAFQKALKELGRNDVRVMMGSWNFVWMEQSDPWTPKGIPFMPLDWDVVLDKSHFATPEARAEIRAVAARRPVIPIAWGHHDDGQYIGRSYRPPDRFLDVLADCGASSFGIIHWTTRPLDLFFKSLSEQVWSATSNRDLRATCDDMAARALGPSARTAGGEYLFDWITAGPIFGRDTSDFFIDRPFPPERVAEGVAGARRRIALLDRIDPASLSPEGRERREYFKGMEEFIAAFHEAEGAHQQATEAFRRGDIAAARRIVEPLDPARIASGYARASSHGGITRGELGVLVTMNLKWVTYVRALRQAAGLEPVRIAYGPTQQEDLAQGPGRLTFHADPEGGIWRVFGTRETKAAEFSVPADEILRLPDGAPAAFAALARAGIATDQPLTLHIQPILNPKGGPELKVPAGNHRLTLLFAGPVRPEDGPVAFDVAVAAGGTPGQTFRCAPTRAKHLRIVGHGSDENDWFSINEVRCSALDPAVAPTASAAVKDFDAAKAADGNPATRWAARGDGASIRFGLKPDVAFDCMEFDWYNGDKRRYVFDVQVSDDGNAWRTVPAATTTHPAARQAATVSLSRAAGEPIRTEIRTFDLRLDASAAVDVTLTPRQGRARISAAILEPRTEP